MPTKESVREVVQRLRLENSEALLELLEFDGAFEEFLQNLEKLVVVAQALEAAACAVHGGEDEQEQCRAMRELASRLNAGISDFAGAFQQIHRGVKEWNIADARRDSAQPSSGKRPMPKE